MAGDGGGTRGLGAVGVGGVVGNMTYNPCRKAHTSDVSDSKLLLKGIHVLFRSVQVSSYKISALGQQKIQFHGFAVCYPSILYFTRRYFML